MVLVLTLVLVIGANLLVSAALVPSFMEKLEAFQTITEDSMAALVHTDDITSNQQEAYSETKPVAGDGGPSDTFGRDGRRIPAGGGGVSSLGGEQPVDAPASRV